VRLGIAGPSRSGKSYSALRIARGMVNGDMAKVFAINTERGGINIYADHKEFSGFMCGQLTAPFAPARYLDAIHTAQSVGAKVVIIDSASHLHEGEGGVLMMHEAELNRMAGDDPVKRERVKFAAWIKPKAEHTRFVNQVMKLTVHTIWCFRAKEKLRMVRNKDGRIEPQMMGYQPIITDGFEYEMLSLIVLGENARGVPDLEAQASSFREPIDRMVQPGAALDETFGVRLADWASGAREIEKAFVLAGEQVALEGMTRLQEWWTSSIIRPNQKMLEPHLGRFKEIALKADSAKAHV